LVDGKAGYSACHKAGLKAVQSAAEKAYLLVGLMVDSRVENLAELWDLYSADSLVVLKVA
jgi:predicted metal-binding protein